MSAHEARLVGRDEIAQATLAFRFERPAGFVFRPGQAVNLTLPEPPGDDPKSARHAFSIASAPFEDELVVATRMRDTAYKRALGALPMGAKVRIDGPFGKLTWHADRARPAVLIAGGIGITPFMSMLRQAARDDWPGPVSLVYSDRRPEGAAYLAELEALARSHRSRFRLLATMTGMGSTAGAWRGETRRIDAALTALAAATFAAPAYYVVGPPAMVAGVRATLLAAGVIEEDIRSETFYGY